MSIPKLHKSTHEQFAHIIANQLREHIRLKGSALLCVSGGRSPIPFFEVLCLQDIPWNKVCVSLVDERWVESNHPDRNEVMLNKYLLQNNAQEASFISLGMTGESIETSTQRLNLLKLRPDICVLGMGEDGHTASLFPNSNELEGALSDDAPDYIITHPPKAPYERISMSLPQILRAHHTYIAISGDSKRHIWNMAALHPNDMRWPISYVLHHTQVQSYDIAS
jgi:6-phosphogluconolactonase